MEVKLNNFFGNKTLDKVLKEFNNYRYPECEAKLLHFSQDKIIVEFSGTKASFACCFDENFVDFKYYLEDFLKEKFEISKVERTDIDKFLVEYSLSYQ